MLMANSVEGRFPFLDVNVAEFAARLPEGLRLRDLEEKYLLRRAVRPLLPADVGARRKRPYRAPIHGAFFGPGAPPYVAEMLDPERVAASELFDPRAVAALVAKGKRYRDVGLGEGDEMGLVGVLSTLLLDEQLVRNPRAGRAGGAGPGGGRRHRSRRGRARLRRARGRRSGRDAARPASAARQPAGECGGRARQGRPSSRAGGA